ncbi:potassium channel family protein [Agromyces sp. Marseille-P2726]|uniref:potassium channel family protein n=1 Tax=Agromyces sp. Marseille-P2726 TaxID=2709132 RepID=UPI00156FBD04|nr:potassium channel family protein [Agromyces sp. Marseille-P2726]
MVATDPATPTAPAPAPARERWERRTSTLLAVLGVIFIVLYSFVVLAPEFLTDDLPSWATTSIVVLLIVVWVAFIIDVVVRVLLTPRGARWSFIWRHPIDVLSAVIPLFRALRVVQLLREVPYLQRRTGAAVRTTIVTFALSYATVFVYFISLATLAAERDAPGATITSFGDAVWWAVVTIATVGYGDMVPITIPGRLYAVILMAGGIAIVGVASATVISFINERVGAARRRGDERGGAPHPPLEQPRLEEPREEPPATGSL